MSNDKTPYLHIGYRNKRKELPELDDSLTCPEHPDAPVDSGYGMAGGGMGIYTCCSMCGRILSKSEDPE